MLCCPRKRWLSGLRHRANAAYGQPYRGFESLPSPPFDRGRYLGRSTVALPAAMMRESEIKFAGLTMVEVAKRFADWRAKNPDAIIIDRGGIARLPQLLQRDIALVRNAFSLTVKYRIWPRSGRPPK